MSEAHAIGSAVLIEVGNCVYSKNRRHGRDDRPIGGVVVGVDHRMVLEDGEPTGEAETVYEVLDPFENDISRAFDHVDLAEVDLEIVEPPNDWRMRQLVCRLDAEVVKGGRRIFDARHERYQRTAGLLMAVIFGAHR